MKQSLPSLELQPIAPNDLSQAVKSSLGLRHHNMQQKQSNQQIHNHEQDNVYVCCVTRGWCVLHFSSTNRSLTSLSTVRLFSSAFLYFPRLAVNSLSPSTIKGRPAFVPPLPGPFLPPLPSAAFESGTESSSLISKESPHPIWNLSLKNPASSMSSSSSLSFSCPCLVFRREYPNRLVCNTLKQIRRRRKQICSRVSGRCRTPILGTCIHQCMGKSCTTSSHCSTSWRPRFSPLSVDSVLDENELK